MEQSFQPQTEALTQVEQDNGPCSLQNPDGRTESLPNAEKEAAAVLETLLQHYATHRARENWMGLVWGMTFMLVMVLPLPFLCQSNSMFVLSNSIIKTSMLVCFTLFAVGGIVGWGWHNRGVGKRDRALLDAVTQIHDKQYVGLLVRALQAPASVRNIAKLRLRMLLPTLQEDDAALFSMAERNDLRYYLSETPFEMYLQVAILQGMAQFGGEQDLEVVKRLARRLPTFGIPSGVPKELCTAAAACRLRLEARLKDQRVGAQLLRASSVPTCSGADLLRPATEAASTPPEQLLRASE